MRLSKRNRWRRAVLDPVLFAREFVEIEPHEGQIAWLKGSTKPENLLCTGNRWGKSLIQAVKILHRCIFRIRSLKYDSAGRYNALNASITSDQAKIVFLNVMRLIKGKPIVEAVINAVRWSPYPRLYFANGAVLSARSTQNRGEYLLGNDYDYINFDEAAFEIHPEYVVDEVMAMRLADREGMIDMTSTPKGKNWFFTRYESMRKRPGSCFVHQGTTLENPHVSRRYVDRKIRTLSGAVVQQNVMGAFVESGDEILTENQIQAAMARSTGLSGSRQGRIYCHGWDLARKVTHTVGVTLDITERPFQVVAIERFQALDWSCVISRIKARYRRYGGLVLVDETGLGDVVLSQLSDIGAEGYNFGRGGGQAKADLLLNLELMHESGEIAYPYFEQVSGDEMWSSCGELREATWTHNGFADFLMALALACWIPSRGKNSLERPIRPRVDRV